MVVMQESDDEDSRESHDDDLSDDAMMRIDSMLSEIFRQRKVSSNGVNRAVPDPYRTVGCSAKLRLCLRRNRNKRKNGAARCKWPTFNFVAWT